MVPRGFGDEGEPGEGALQDAQEHSIINAELYDSEEEEE